MLAYYGYTVSPNQIETGEGFLICKNVPIARTGDMEYLGREIGLEGAPADQAVTVHRSPEEVFAEAALASFEGKPVTNDHPPELIGPDEVKKYEMGHAQNIRQGAGEWEGYVIADLHIHDRELISAIQGGKREISCGYECEYLDNGDGTYSQKNIRGNHVAVVDRGRAGKRAAILDSDTVKKQAEGRPERMIKMKKHGLLFKLFGQAANGKSAEEIEQMAMDAADAFEEETASSDDALGAGKESEESAAKEEKTETGDGFGGSAAPAGGQEAMIAAIVKQVMAAMAKAQAEEKNPIDAAIEKLGGGDKEEAVSGEAKVVPAEEMDKTGCGIDQAAALEMLKRLRPSVAAIQDEAQKKAVADAILSCIVGDESGGDIAKIVKTAQKNAKSAADGISRKEDRLSELQSAYDKQNPHRQQNSENGGMK